MTPLETAILDVLDETQRMSVNQVDRELEIKPEYGGVRDIVDTLESLSRAGYVAQSWSHGGSVFRKLSDRERIEREAVKAGTQRELL